MKLLVVEGNTLTARQARLQKMGKTPAQSYADVLQGIAEAAHLPVARIDIVNSADANASLAHGMALSAYSGIALTGSALQIYETSPEVTRQIEFMRAAFAARVPIFGSCWGLQVASVAAGGTVIRNPLGREIGIARNIWTTAEGEGHPLLKGRARAFNAPCVHYDIVSSLPPDSTCLAQNHYAAVQAAEIRYEGGLFWGVQYHPEYDLSQIAALLDMARVSLVKEGFLTDQAEVDALIADFNHLHAHPASKSVAWRLGLQADVIEQSQRQLELHNWLDYCVRPRML